MASKAETTATKARKTAAPKVAPAKPVVTAAEAKPEKAEQLVTSIVSVDDKPLSEGVKKMTDTVEKTAKEAQAKLNSEIERERAGVDQTINTKVADAE